jgi:acyl-CoA thioesterase-1
MTRIIRSVGDICLSLALLAVAGCGGGSSSSTTASSSIDFGQNNPLKVTAFGDSITQGVLELQRRDLGLSTSNNYPAVLQGKLKALNPAWAVVNRGVGGEETRGGAARLPGVLALDHSGFVLIMEGANDATDCLDASSIAANLRGMVQIAKANKTVPIIGTVPPNFRNDPCARDVVNQVNVEVRNIASSENIVLAEIFEGMNDRSLFGQSPSRDPLHPNDRGYAVMADIWFQAMLKAVPSAPPAPAPSAPPATAPSVPPSTALGRRR